MEELNKELQPQPERETKTLGTFNTRQGRQERDPVTALHVASTGVLPPTKSAIERLAAVNEAIALLKTPFPKVSRPLQTSIPPLLGVEIALGEKRRRYSYGRTMDGYRLNRMREHCVLTSDQFCRCRSSRTSSLTPTSRVSRSSTAAGVRERLTVRCEDIYAT